MGLRALGRREGRPGRASSPRTGPEWAYRRPRHAWPPARSTCPIYATLTPAQVLYILNDSEAKVLLRLERRPGAQGRGGPRARRTHLQHVIRMEDGRRARRARSRSTRCAAQGREALARRPGRGARSARRRSQPDGPGHAHLHLGHHRRPQGRDAHALATSSRTSIGSGQVFDAAGPGRRGALLPAALPRLRAHGRPLPDAATQGATIAYAESVEKVPANMARGAADRDVLGAAPLREDVRARPREGGGRSARCARRSSAGRIGRGPRGVPAPGASARRRACLLRLKRARRRHARLLEDQGAHGRAAAPLRLRRRAARPRDRGVLRRGRAS